MGTYIRKNNPEIRGNDIICKKGDKEYLAHWTQLNDEIVKEYFKTVVKDEKAIAEINKDYEKAVENAPKIEEKVKNIVLYNNQPIVKAIKNGKPVYMKEEIKTGNLITKTVNYRKWFWENVLKYKTVDKAVVKNTDYVKPVYDK